MSTALIFVIGLILTVVTLFVYFWGDTAFMAARERTFKIIEKRRGFETNPFMAGFFVFILKRPVPILVVYDEESGTEEELKVEDVFYNRMEVGQRVRMVYRVGRFIGHADVISFTRLE